MSRKGFNWKARNVTEVKIDDSGTEKIKIDIGTRGESYDQCNALVIPNKKRQTKSKDNRIAVTRLLSKKRRKELEKVVDRKRKKANRATLLEQLAKVQAPEEELKQYLTLAAIQTKGLKRHFTEVDKGLRQKIPKLESESDEVITNSIRGANRTRIALLGSNVKDNGPADPNVVGLDESSESEGESEAESSEKEVDDESKSGNEYDKVANDLAEDQRARKIGKEVVEIENEEILLKETNDSHQVEPAKRVPAIFVTLNRKPGMQMARLKLPILAEEQSIMETINDNPVVIIAGETGSGKTTQVPQFLYEAGYAEDKMIGVTEPRRVAAISMSKRVAEEMNLTSEEVSYLIRFEGNTTPNTKIKFMTDGVLLKEIQSDFLLTKYSVIILDEAHERSVYTDILIGLLSRIVPLRNKRNIPLKLIIMSATLRIEDFTENPKLFKVKPPVIKVESRQFPVTIHFNKRTSQNYVKDALYKAVKIHTQLPDGGILIFLTGQQEVNTVVRKLRKAFPLRNKKYALAQREAQKTKTTEEINSNNSESDEDLDMDRVVRNARRNKKKSLEIKLPELSLDNYDITPPDDTDGDLLDTVENDNEEEEEEQEDDDENEDLKNLMGLSCTQPLWVLPLYSLLPSHKQARVFDPPPEGCRLCVVSTNVAETSLTIPNVKYVVDSGRCKTRLYDKVTGVNAFQVCYASKAAANQRAGRAGRTGPGHCYRLYSSAVFNDQFEQFAMPEIQKKPVDDLLLQMKVMNIDKVVNFPFPSSPDILQLKCAEKRLQILGALDESISIRKEDYCAKVTPLGYSMAAFPVAPRYGKMLALSQQHDLLQYTVCLVAALSVQEVLIESNPKLGSTKNQWNQTRRSWAGIGNSLLLGDPMVLIRAVGAAEYAGSGGEMVKFCDEHGLRHKAIMEIRKLRQQLTNEIVLNIPNLDLNVDPRMPPPSDTQAKLLRQILLSGMADQVARKVSPDEIKEDQDKAKWKYAYRCLEMEDPVFMHSSSVLRKTYPEWVVYQEVYETNKIYMRGITAIQPEWLPKFAKSLCQLSEPLSDPPPKFDSALGKVMCHITGTFGRGGWELPIIEIEYPNCLEGVKWFARFFLEGKVYAKLKRFTPLLLSTPTTMNKTWAKLIPRTEAIIKTLLTNQVTSRDKLNKIWETDSKFLLSAYQKWLPESAQAEVALIWPPI